MIKRLCLILGILFLAWPVWGGSTYLFPTGDSNPLYPTLQNFTGSGCTNKYECVDDGSSETPTYSDDDTTYIYYYQSSTTRGNISFTIEDLPEAFSDSTPISKVIFHYRVKDDSSTGTFRTTIVSGSTVTQSSLTATSSYEWQYFERELAPGDTAWTKSLVNALTCGIYTYTDYRGTLDVTSCYVEVQSPLSFTADTSWHIVSGDLELVEIEWKNGMPLGMSWMAWNIDSATDKNALRPNTYKLAQSDVCIASRSTITTAETPNIIYVNSERKTYYVFRVEDDPDVYAYIGYYDHRTGAFSSLYQIGASSLAITDNHDQPMILDDTDYKVFLVVFGAHGGDFEVYRSGLNYDITSWTDITSYTTGVLKGTYPQGAFYSGVGYVLFRGYSSGSRAVIAHASYPYESWSTQSVLDQSGFTCTDDIGDCVSGDCDYEPYRVYCVGGLNVHNGKLHFESNVECYDDSYIYNQYRTNVIHLYLDPSDNHVYDLAGNDYGTEATITEIEGMSGTPAYAREGILVQNNDTFIFSGDDVYTAIKKYDEGQTLYAGSSVNVGNGWYEVLHWDATAEEWSYEVIKEKYTPTGYYTSSDYQDTWSTILRFNDDGDLVFGSANYSLIKNIETGIWSPFIITGTDDILNSSGIKATHGAVGYQSASRPSFDVCPEVRIVDDLTGTDAKDIYISVDLADQLIFTFVNGTDWDTYGTLSGLTVEHDGSLIVTPGQAFGTWTSDSLDISSVGTVVNATVSYLRNAGSVLGVVIETNVALDGSTWEGWEKNVYQITDLTPGADASSAAMKVRATLTRMTDDDGTSPALHAVWIGFYKNPLTFVQDIEWSIPHYFDQDMEWRILQNVYRIISSGGIHEPIGVVQ